ncbi:MAG: hypothetical protein JJU26_03970 [Oceanicaulis sp.]|nr:hypothetical protein [Glycocaulis sp.]MCC5980858.1 hypothetical protein [Oceanicaulis sp.]MCH8521692.1 hypothetical protein [Glycocaulis sp.]
MLETTLGILLLAVVLGFLFGRGTRARRERAAEAARKAVEDKLNKKR